MKYTLILFNIIFLVIYSCEKTGSDKRLDIYEPDTDFKVVGYLYSGNFDRIDELEIDKLTYLNLAFCNPDKDGDLVIDGNVDIKSVVKKGHEANLKVYISLAGGGNPDVNNWKTLLLPSNRSLFINKILKYVGENDLDGVDVDIEGNLLPYLIGTYSPFILELKEALHSKGKGITAALGPTYVYTAADQKALEAFDFINIMVYDMTGIWNPENIGPHSPWSLAEAAVKFWTVDKKIPADRIILGVPFYGYDFSTPAHYVTFREIVEEDLSFAYVDSIDLKYYNGIPLIVKKTELARRTLGGVMIWEISYDAPGEMSLLRAIDQTLSAGDCNVTIYYRDEDGDGSGNPAKPFHACSVPPGYVTNMNDKDDTPPWHP